MSLEAKDVEEILRLLEESAFDELVLETEGFKLTLSRNAAGAVQRTSDRPAAEASDAAPAAPTAPAAPAPAAPANQGGLTDVPAPLLGVFYRAPKPGAEPFVDVGARVEPDTVIGIIEVMKLMNSVRAGVAGDVVEIPAQNGSMVEFGEALIRVRADG